METYGNKEDVEAIQKIWRNYGARLVAGDADGHMSQWHPDGVQLPPDGPVNVGRDTIDVQLRDEMSRLDYNAVEVQPREIRVTSDTTAYAWGKFAMKLTEKSTGDVTELDGKFCTLLVKTPDGAWKIYRDCFNWIVLSGDANR
jgi:uncharacterized protein (TIGR02246 family)